MTQHSRSEEAESDAEVAGPVDSVGAALRSIDGVLEVRQEEDDGEATAWVVTASPGQDVRDAVGRCVIDGGYGLRELRRLEMTLEDIYLRLTNEAAVSTTQDAPSV